MRATITHKNRMNLRYFQKENRHSRRAADLELGAIYAFADLHQLGVTAARLLEEVPNVGDLLRLPIGRSSERNKREIQALVCCEDVYGSGAFMTGPAVCSAGETP